MSMKHDTDHCTGVFAVSSGSMAVSFSTIERFIRESSCSADAKEFPDPSGFAGRLIDLS